MSYEAWGDGDPGPDWRDYALDHGWIDPVDMSKALLDVMNERHRQWDEEGWSPEHDDTHRRGEMAFAAACYAFHAGETADGAVDGRLPTLEQATYWPWAQEWWKPSDNPRRDLVKAAALILAEIERLDRLAADAPTPGEGDSENQQEQP